MRHDPDSSEDHRARRPSGCRARLRAGSLVTWFLSSGFLTSGFLSIPAAARADTVRVEIDGVRGEARSNLELVLRELQLDGKTELPETSIESRVARLDQLVPRALEPFGYYRSRVSTDRSVEGDRHTVRLAIDPGPAVTLSSLEIEVAGPGSEDPRIVRTRAAFPLAPGDRLLHAEWESGKAAMLLAAESSGYLEAYLDQHRVEVDADEGTATGRLRLYTGRRFVFGPLLTDQQALSPELFSNYMTFVPGDPFQYAALQELQGALVSSGYFDRVEVEALPQLEGPLPPLAVPIQVTATPARPQRYRMGVGYRTDIGARLSVGVELRRINRRGHRFDSTLQLAEKQNLARAEYVVPRLSRPRTDRVLYEVAYGDERPQTSQSQVAFAGVRLSRQREVWEDVLGLRYRRDDFVLGSAEQRRLDTTGTLSDVTDLLVLSASRTRVRRDDPIYVRRGSRLLVELSGAESSLISDAAFARATVEGKWIRRAGEHGRFLARFSTGYVVTSDFAKLPPSFRFFTGGDQSVRGFGYQELGPTNADGVVLGGDAAATASVEYERRLFDSRRLGRWSVAAFVDAGDAFDVDRPPSFGDLRSGAGLGLRWLSPIGLVRVDVASAWTEPGAPLRFHLTIGPDL
ncbi:MAG TPA: autotransporter assembly complex family protein [Thermoanaerobaculia bacterium]|nr:autotransporter assembly complex family protein [Thermoanaerobaculia bacterium]